jgi:hypothetical protein
LTGPNVHVYSDVNDNKRGRRRRGHPSSDAAGNFNYTFQQFGTPPFGNTTNSDCTDLLPVTGRSR